MFKNWPILFIVIPLAELYFMIKIGELIGAFWTVALVLFTAFIGINLLRYQGLNMLAKAQQNLSRGIIPAMEMMEGMVLAVGAVLLITPGFITDTLGFLCLLPITRRMIIRYIVARTTVHANDHFQSNSFDSSQHPKNFGFGDTLPEEDFVDGYQPKQAEKTTGKKVKPGRTIEGECHRED